MIRLGIIGLGKQGREHLAAASGASLANIVVAQDIVEDARDAVAADYPSLELVTSIADLSRFQLDGLVMALPHHCYEDIWPQVLSLGVPILKEKPLGRNLEEVNHFLQMAEEANCSLQTAIQRRAHPSYIELEKRLRNKGRVKEIRARLHLGFDPQGSSGSWRAERKTAGGGALLDCGYHLIDLVHFLIGRFELLSSGLWDSDGHMLATFPARIETEARLVGRQGNTWIVIESLVGGRKDEEGRYQKFESVEVLTDQHKFVANREGLVCNGEPVFRCRRDWDVAMAAQLDSFASNIQNDTWHAQEHWDQIPIMKLIDQAYLGSFAAS